MEWKIYFQVQSFFFLIFTSVGGKFIYIYEIKEKKKGHRLFNAQQFQFLIY